MDLKPSLSPSVVCAQIGARDHYSVARAFHRQGALASLVTDIWTPRRRSGEWPWLRRLAGRWHSDLDQAPVTSMRLPGLAQEALLRALRKDEWETITCRNARFQSWAVNRIEWKKITANAQQPPVLFAYSYAALGLLKQAKACGWTTVLGQIDPGPLDWKVSQTVSQQYPEFRELRRPAPAEYYREWRRELELADRIVVNSDWSAQALLAEGVPQDRVQMVPLAYAVPALRGGRGKPYPDQFSRSRPLRVLFLGQITLRKGVAEIMLAMERLSGSPVELWMAGPLKCVVPDRFLRHPKIHWLGSLARSQVGRLYQEADVFLFPTHSDGFGLTQLEALSWQTPVIASKNCGEVVRHNVNGWQLPEVSPAAIQESLLRCLESPQLLRSLSSNAKVDPSNQLEAVGKQLLEGSGTVRVPS